MSELLEYVIRLRGGPAAAAEVKGLRTEFTKLAASQKANTAASKAGLASSTKMGAALGIVTKGAKVGVLAVGALALESTNLNNKFQTQMSQIGIVTGESQKQLQGVRNSILDLAKPTGAKPTDLAESFAHISKIDLPGVDKLRLLHAAADGAAVGLANVVTTTDTLAGAMKVHMPGLATDSRKAMAQLVTAAQTGNMSLEDLNHAMGTGVLPVAKNYGLTLTDITGALAVFTDEHMSASGSMAQLSTAFHFLTGATAKGEKALERIGLSGLRLAGDMRGPRGLQTALKELRTHLDAFSPDKNKQTELLQQILPGGRGRVLQVLMNQLDNYGLKMDQQIRTNSRFEDSVRKAHDAPAFKLKAAWAGVLAQMIRLGDGIKTYMIPALLWATVALSTLIGWVMAAPHALSAAYQWFMQSGSAVHFVAEALGIMVAQGLALFAVVKVIALVRAAIFSIRGTILAVRAAFILFQLSSGPLILGIMLVVAALVLLITHSKQVRNALGDVWTWIKSNWPYLAGALFGPFGLAAAYILTHLDDVVGFVQAMPGRIAGVAVGMFDGVLAAFKSAINAIIGLWNGFHLHLGGVKIHGHTVIPGFTLNTPDVPLLAKGGVAMAGGAAIVGDAGPEVIDMPAGARVRPLSGAPDALPFRDIVLQVSGREIARVNRSEVLEAQARGA